VVFAFLLALVALTIKTQFPGLDPDLALIHGFGNLLPAGFLGLASILLFAAIMSSIDTYIFTGASSITQDFFDWDKKTTVKYLKKVIFGLAIIGTIIAILLQSLIIGSYIFVASLVILSVTVIATWINKNIKQRTLLFGLIFGIIGFVIFLIMSLLKGYIEPTIVIVALGSSLVGLIIGRIVSIFKK
jgi:Na+/proline symporter